MLVALSFSGTIKEFREYLSFLDLGRISQLYTVGEIAKLMAMDVIE